MRRPFALASLALGTLAGCPSPSPTDSAPRTLVLVTLDTLRRDHVGAFGSSRDLTPSLDAFARTAIRFDDARTPVPLTLPAHATMFTGLPPAVHGARTNTASSVPPRAERPYALLAERLSESGRCCGAFVSAEPLSPRYGLTQGFSVYDAEGVTGGIGSVTYVRRSGRETVARALAWLRARRKDEPVFLWVHLFDAHEPHPTDYAGSVREADRAFGTLVEGIGEARGEAAILVTADHGEALGDLLEPSHGFLLGESVLRIPMLLRAPSLAPGARSDPADLADVAPTLAALCAVPWPTPPDVPGVGRDLLAGPAPADRVRVAETLHSHHQHRWAQLIAATAGGWKLEDRGAGRERIQRIDAPDATTTDGAPAAGSSEALRLAQALRAYRRVEDRRPRAPGSTPGGYGTGGSVGFFLEPVDNAALPDPYEVITDDARLQRVVGLLSRAPPAPPKALEAALLDPIGVLEARDRGDPALAFWKGRILARLGRLDDAVRSFDRAIGLGGPNAEADLLAARSERALNRPDQALARVERGRAVLRADARLETEAAEALRSLGRGEEARAAEQTAERLRQGAREPPTLAPCR